MHAPNDHLRKRAFGVVPINVREWSFLTLTTSGCFLLGYSIFLLMGSHGARILGIDRPGNALALLALLYVAVISATLLCWWVEAKFPLRSTFYLFCSAMLLSRIIHVFAFEH